MNSTSTRRLVRMLGLAISLAAVVWIGVRFVRSGALDLLAGAPSGGAHLAVSLLAAAVAYALASCLLAIAWWRLVAELAAQPISAWRVVPVFAVAQYGKYLPGNVAHYAIRHAWSRRYDIAHAQLALASLLEAALLVLCALFLALLADTRELGTIAMPDPRLAIALLIAMLIGLGVVLRASRRAAWLDRFHLPALPGVPVLAFCAACYVAFLAASAGILDALAHALGIRVESFALLLAASAASWLAGFVVVGAPGGLGVREAAFVALAGAALGESRALLLIGCFRIVTFLGDTLFFAAGAWIARRGDRDADAILPSRHESPP